MPSPESPVMAQDDSDLSSLLSSVPASPPSSPLSSLASRSPSPPPDMLFQCTQTAPYPSPPASQQASQSGSPDPDGMDSSAQNDKDGPPPAKRRRISKERTVAHLDLRSPLTHPHQQHQLDRLLKVLHKCQKIVVIAGAGISVSAGIPDFRSSQGLFRSLKEEYNLKGSGKHLFDASVYKDDVATSSFHDMISTMSRLTKSAEPTAFHHMLATIAQENRLLRLYSQNVDGIDTSLCPLKTSIPLRKSADGKWPRTVQLHGGLDKMVCSKCQELSDLDPELFTGPVPPLCSTCIEVNNIRTNHEGKRSHGIGRLRPRMVLYNEHNPDDEAIGGVTKEDLRRRPDAVIVVGTTLKVPGVRRIVREMCATVRDRRGGVTIWINNDPPPLAKDLEDCWDIIVQGTSDEVAKYAAMRKWNEPEIVDEFLEINEEDAQKASQKALRVDLASAVRGPDHAPAISLPSSAHKNNSFLPLDPMSTPRKSPRLSPDWSPIGSPGPLVLESIEPRLAENRSTFNLNGNRIHSSAGFALSPPDSGSCTPTKKKSLTKQASLNHAARQSTQAKTNSKGRLTASVVNIGKPLKAKSVKQVPKTVSKRKAGTTSTNAQLGFKASKVPDFNAKGIKSHIISPSNTPRKLSHGTSVPASLHSEPMHPLSPQDPRNNTSPPAMEQVPMANGWND